MSEVLHRITLDHITGIDLSRYGVSAWIHDPDLTAVASVVKKHWKLTGDVVSEMSQSEKDAVDATELDDYKLAKESEIDVRSNELIIGGVEWPASSGEYLSMSQTAQINLDVLDRIRDDLDPVDDYPIVFNYNDNHASYSCADAATLHNIFLSALVFKRTILDAGTTLKDSIRAATDQAGVDAVVDSR